MLLSTSGKGITTDLGVDATCHAPTTNNTVSTNPPIYQDLMDISVGQKAVKYTYFM